MPSCLRAFLCAHLCCSGLGPGPSPTGLPAWARARASTLLPRKMKCAVLKCQFPEGATQGRKKEAKSPGLHCGTRAALSKMPRSA